MRTLLLGVLAAMTVGGLTPSAPAAEIQADDPFQWLEDVEGKAALDWVRARNATSLATLEAQPGFAGYRARAEAILSDKQRIPFAAIQGQSVVGFWQDDQHVRGIWRTSPLKDYLAGKPAWRTLIDVDALAKAEGENWVWKGAQCLMPAYDRCLVSLSRGGKDAVELREFDMKSGQFVADGFRLPEAKARVDWFDRDSLLVGTDYGPGSLTESGYPRIIKLWKRGTPLADARTLFEGKTDDVWAAPDTRIGVDGAFRTIVRGLTFWTAEIYHVANDGALARSPLPLDADFKGVFSGLAVALLRGDWTHDGVTYRRGALVAYPVRPLVNAGATKVELVYAPPAGVAVYEVAGARDVLYVTVLDKVRGRLLALNRGEPAWKVRDMAVPPNGALHLISTSDDSNLVLLTHEGFTTPQTLLAVDEGRQQSPYRLPQRFDPARFIVEQAFATSKDGTNIPYWVVRPKNATGPLPTLLYSYGGFEIPLLPNYVTPEVQFWLEDGGAYVVANIRGGGEFGPDWHQSALLEHRQRAYDDFAAVAADLHQRKLTTPAQLGIYGRSNGGLLVSVAFTQHPELYGAVICGVPLADMKRYHKLLAGASWVGEYGNPDDPAQWAYISGYSPYQRLTADARYPRVFFYTSTKDDRVHPGHARKMAARMEAQGHPFFYYENIDGGHAGVANLKETAYRAALMKVYLDSQLKPAGTAAAR